MDTQGTFQNGYDAGSRAAWARILQAALGQLGYDDPAVRHHAWVLEREAAIQTLREVCARLGDNAWPADLHLADILEKHLLNHLE